MSQTKRRLRRALAAAATLAAAVLAASQARAEPVPVGLEARGVDPFAALRQRGRLDVRDADNRPVSAAVIERELRAASSAAAKPLDALSRLPRAARMLEALERLLTLAPILRLAWPFGPAREAWALPWSLRSGPRLQLIPVLLCAVAMLASACKLRPAPAGARLPSGSPDVLLL